MSVRNAPLTRVPDPDTNTILLHTGDANPFPVDVAGPPISSDEEGSVYLGSAVLEYGHEIMPCRVVLQSGAPKVLYSNIVGKEVQHNGYYYLLCFDRRRMHWVSNSPATKPSNAVVGGRRYYWNYSFASTRDLRSGVRNLGYLTVVGVSGFS